MHNIILSQSDVLKAVDTVDGTETIVFDCNLFTNLNERIKTEISFFGKAKNPTSLKDILCKLVIRDVLYEDIILNIEGTLNDDDDDISTLISAAYFSNEFRDFSLTFSNDALSKIIASSAYNPANGIGRNKLSVEHVEVDDNQFSEDELYENLTNLVEEPSYFVLPTISDTNMDVYQAVLRAALTKNIPLDCELDPTSSLEDVISKVYALDAQSHLVQFIWSPNLCRARDSKLLRGKKVPCYVIGQYIGYKMKRNEKLTAQGIPKIADPVGGEPFPFKYKAMESRQDIKTNDPTILERLAVAKINVVRLVNFDTGTKFVLSDILTQYQSPDSALRLVNSSEITSYTTNRVIEILRRHMLKRMKGYLKDASRDIESFLNACSNETAGLLTEAEDLDGLPYTFTLTPDEKMPFERVRLYLARRPEGATRSVIFDDVITK